MTSEERIRSVGLAPNMAVPRDRTPSAPSFDIVRASAEKDFTRERSTSPRSTMACYRIFPDLQSGRCLH